MQFACATCGLFDDHDGEKCGICRDSTTKKGDPRKTIQRLTTENQSLQDQINSRPLPALPESEQTEAALTTEQEIELSRDADNLLATYPLSWSEEATEHEKTLVECNLRSFACHVLRRFKITPNEARIMRDYINFMENQISTLSADNTRLRSERELLKDTLENVIDGLEKYQKVGVSYSKVLNRAKKARIILDRLSDKEK